jgi:hypothetical protein
MRRPAPRLLLALLALLAAAGMVLQAGSLQHLHDNRAAGFYNQEHDLTLLASLAGQATAPDLAPSITIDAVSTPVVTTAPARPNLRAAGSGDSRAPPSA